MPFINTKDVGLVDKGKGGKYPILPPGLELGSH
jgi:hypothetical protein